MRLSWISEQFISLENKEILADLPWSANYFSHPGASPLRREAGLVSRARVELKSEDVSWVVSS